jgi:predicted metalloendopeptidase
VPRVVFTHAVTDVQAWAAHKAERVEFFDAYATDILDYLPTDGGNTVAVSANVNDMDGMLAALQTPEATALEESHGVIQPILSFVEG